MCRIHDQMKQMLCTYARWSKYIEIRFSIKIKIIYHFPYWYEMYECSLKISTPSSTRLFHFFFSIYVLYCIVADVFYENKLLHAHQYKPWGEGRKKKNVCDWIWVIILNSEIGIRIFLLASRYPYYSRNKIICASNVRVRAYVCFNYVNSQLRFVIII